MNNNECEVRTESVIKTLEYLIDGKLAVSPDVSVPVVFIKSVIELVKELKEERSRLVGNLKNGVWKGMKDEDIIWAYEQIFRSCQETIGKLQKEKCEIALTVMDELCKHVSFDGGWEHYRISAERLKCLKMKYQLLNGQEKIKKDGGSEDAEGI